MPAPSIPQLTGLPVRVYTRLAGMRYFETACNLFSTAVFLLLGNAVYQAWIFYLARLRSPAAIPERSGNSAQPFPHKTHLNNGRSSDFARPLG